MRLSLILCGLALGSCSTPRLVETGEVTVTAPLTASMPTRDDLTRASLPYVIGPLDKLSVEVFGIPELTREVQVETSGRIALPLAGEVNVIGKTPQEAQELIEQQLRGSYVRDPRVTLTVLEPVSQTVTVDGAVRMPGVYPVSGSTTLMRAIARAQGTSEVANTSHVVLFRTVEGKQMATLYDLRAIRRAAYEDPQIYPYDVVVVGESAARRLFPQILNATGLLLTPLTTVLTR